MDYKRENVIIMSVSHGGSEERIVSTAVILAKLLGVGLDDERARELLREMSASSYVQADGNAYRLTAEGAKLYASFRAELERLGRTDVLKALDMIEMITLDDLKVLARAAEETEKRKRAGMASADPAEKPKK